VGSREIGPERINWEGRRTYIVYDAGLRDNVQVALGLAITATVLQKLGADVYIVRIPFMRSEDSDPENGIFYSETDQGPDDFLARSGKTIEERKAAMDALIAEAIPACPLARIRAAVGG